MLCYKLFKESITKCSSICLKVICKLWSFDLKTGEAVKAATVKKAPALAEEALRNYCWEYLSGYKISRYIDFWHGLSQLRSHTTSCVRALNMGLTLPNSRHQPTACADV